MNENDRRIQVVACLSFAAALSLPASRARAWHPTGDCDGAQSAGQVGRASFVQSTAILEKFADGDFASYMSSQQSLHAERGDVLIHTPWSAPPATGHLYRIRLETVIFDGLEESNPSAATLAAWPESQRFRLSATGSPFSCESARPIINSSPETSANTSDEYSYAPSISQSGANPLRFTLLAAPPGMIIDDIFGDITWQASAADAGRVRSVILLVEDTTTHFTDVQAFQIAVAN